VAVELDVGAEARVNAPWIAPTRFFGVEVLYPHAAWALLLVPIVLAFALWGLRRRAHDRNLLVAPRLQSRFFAGFSSHRAIARVVLASVAVAMIALALIGPVSGFTLREVQRRGLDIVICVDTSRSMLVQDLKKNRLERAQREVRGLLDKLQGDRAALLAFSGDVREVAPLTHDRKTLEIFVGTLNPEENTRGGTDIGGVLERALELFDGRTGAHEAVVLLTDGEDLEGRGLEVARKARERNIKVYVIGMATAEGGKIPDGAQGFVRDESGKEVVSRLGRESLTAIAEETGGAFLAADSSPTPLEEMYAKRISQLEGRELFAGKERIPHDRYQWPLAVAAACMLVEAAMRERRGGAKRSISRAQPAKEAA
jgi:Ca-activated chloride channel family protein